MSDIKDSDDKSAAQTSAPAAAPVKKRRRWPWVLVGLVVLAIVAYVPFYYTANPESCIRCHAMQPYYDSWKKSFHGENETNCNECHVRPGWLPYLTYRLGFYGEIVAEVFNLKMAPWGTSSPPESSCLRSNCHTLNRVYSPSGDLKLNQLLHNKKVHKPCSVCHGGASHAGVKGIGPRTPPRKLCFLCHQDKATTCSFCHTAKYKDNTALQKPHL